jgi:hypothetical protein
MAKTHWTRLTAQPNEANLLIVALPQDDAKTLHLGPRCQ